MADRDVALLRPFELRPGVQYFGSKLGTDDVWNLLNAARNGDLESVDFITDEKPAVTNVGYWYMPPLHFAVREGHLDVVKLLIERGADTSLRSIDGKETLHQCASDREHHAVASLLDTLQPELSARDLPIHDSVKQGNIEQVKSYLIDAWELANANGRLGRKPIHYAIENQDQEMVRTLLANGAEVDALGFSSDDRVGNPGFRPVVLALWKHGYWSQRNDYVMVRLLLESGADYSITIAAAMGDQRRVSDLIAMSPDCVNEAETCGKRAISAAAERGHFDLVKTLLEAGADPNLSEGDNCPRGFALWAASRAGSLDIAQLLLDHGADPNASVESSGSPTECAQSKEMRALLYRYGGKKNMTSHFHDANVDVVAAVLDYGREDIFDELTTTDAFTAAVSNNDGDMLRLLLSRNLRLPPTVTSCQTYLWWHLELTELLLDHGMDPDLPNWQQIRPLHHQAAKGDVEAAKLFLRYGADPRLVDEEYRSTPLGWAARAGQLKFVKWLLDYDATLKSYDPPEQPEWARPLAWARKRGHKEIENLLT